MAQLDTISALSLAFLPKVIEAFLADPAAIDAKWTPTRLGKEALKNPGAVFLIRSGRTTRPLTARKILAVIEGARPGFVQETVVKLAQENMHA